VGAKLSKAQYTVYWTYGDIEFVNVRVLLLTLIALVLCVSTSFAQTDKIRRAGPDKIDNEYIVVLQDDVLPVQVPDIARQLATAHGAELKKVWSAAIKGFSATMPEARAQAMSHNPHVKYVEENARMYLSSTMSTNINPANCDPTVTTCTAMTDNRLWHLDRADQNYADPNNSYSYCTTGNNVTIYVVDTGVAGSHAEFGGRVQPGFNASNDSMPANDPCLGFAVAPTGLYSGLEQGPYTAQWQGSGHGTSVASAAAGTRVGVAKNATIVPVKVSRCDQVSSRYRLSSHLYPQGKTMFVVGANGSIRGYYRATNTGTSDADDGVTPASFPFPTSTWVASWPVGTFSDPRPHRVDGGITWEFVPESDFSSVQTVEMIIDGLNWILGANTGPKSFAVVTLSTYRRRIDIGVASPPSDRANSMEDAIRSLLANNLTVVASANNQNGNACDTSPARLSRGNPDTTVANQVITAGGTMLLNRPWTANLGDPPAVDSDATIADGGGGTHAAKGTEPAHDATKGVRDGRWICGPGDSDGCSNATPTSTLDMTDSGYTSFTGGSNGGQCVTLFAPAKNLFLARITGPNDYRDARLHAALASGTSWSAPIVAGFAARILQGNPTATPQQVYDTMMQNVSVGVLDTDTLDPFDVNGVRITGTPNKFLRLGDVNITVPPHSTPISTTGPTTFTVTAGGTTTVSYQWYQVNSSFDSTTYPRGAHPPNSSTPIGTNSSTLQVTPTTQTAYWVRVSNSCGSADSDIVLATPSTTPNPPANVVATASGATVTITWSASSGADGYRVERKVSSGAWQTAQTINSGAQTSVTDVPSSTSGVVLYRVLARSGSNFSTPGNNDVAFVGTFTDDPVTTSLTIVRAENITEVRRGVNGLLDLSGQAPVYSATATDPNALRSLLIDDADFLTLMQNLNSARSFASLPAIAFRTAPAQGARVFGTQVEDLRLGLK
jgi:hypothetical protein